MSKSALVLFIIPVYKTSVFKPPMKSLLKILTLNKNSLCSGENLDPIIFRPDPNHTPNYLLYVQEVVTHSI